MRHVSVLTALLLFAGVLARSQGVAGQPTLNTTAQVGRNASGLYCAWGSIGQRPRILPPGFELWFARVAVEIDSPTRIANVALTDLELFAQTGETSGLKRIISVDQIDTLRLPNQDNLAYYFQDGLSHPWDGTLPVGKIQLRVYVTLKTEPPASKGWLRARLTVGAHVIESPECAIWPT